MKNKDIDLSILEHAGDDIIDELVSLSPENDRIKRRTFSMAEKKYKDMTDNFENSGGTVRGVETYHRPIWYRTVCAAAAVALVAGGAGVFRLLKNGSSGSSIVPASEIETTGTDENIIETGTAVTSEDITEAAPLSNEEMKAIFEEYFPVFLETEWFNASDRIDENADTVTFLMYNGEKSSVVGENDYSGFTVVGDSLYYPETYYKLNDPRFTTLDELREYFGRYLADPDQFLSIGWDLSGNNEGDVIDTEEKIFPYIIEYNGDIYASRKQKTSDTADMWEDEILSDKAFNVYSDSFTWERISKSYDQAMGQVAIGAALDFVKDVDGNWKLNSGVLPIERYHITKDYSASEYTMLDTPFLDNDIDEERILNNAFGFAKGLDENITENDLSHFETVNELPSDYYHVTDDFVNDQEWYKVYYSTPEDAVIGPIVLYLDRNGTVFGMDYRE